VLHSFVPFLLLKIFTDETTLLQVKGFSKIQKILYKVAILNEMLPEFYKLRGRDENGAPRRLIKPRSESPQIHLFKLPIREYNHPL
jgi:hypothetical protein